MHVYEKKKHIYPQKSLVSMKRSFDFASTDRFSWPKLSAMGWHKLFWSVWNVFRYNECLLFTSSASSEAQIIYYIIKTYSGFSHWQEVNFFSFDSLDETTVLYLQTFYALFNAIIKFAALDGNIKFVKSD